MLLYDYCACMGGRCAPAPFRFVCLHPPSTGTGSNTHLHVDLQIRRTSLLLTTLKIIKISDFEILTTGMPVFLQS